MDKTDPPHEWNEDEPDNLNEHLEEPGDPDGLVQADDQRKWQAEHPAPPSDPTQPQRKKRRWPVVLLVLVLIAAAGGGAYWFGGRQAAKTTPQTTKQASTGAPKQAAQVPVVPTTHYDSGTYTLGFDYPKTWKVSDTTTKLTVTSPAMQLAAVGGTTTSAHVVVTMQNQQATIAGYPANGAIASLLSDKLTYKQPTSVQRAQTYLSYLGYSQTNGLNALYITGDSGYQQGQQVPMSDVVKGNPLISVTFQTCTSSDCSTGTPTPVTLLASKWKGTAADKAITNLLESITLD